MLTGRSLLLSHRLAGTELICNALGCIFSHNDRGCYSNAECDIRGCSIATSALELNSSSLLTLSGVKIRHGNCRQPPQHCPAFIPHSHRLPPRDNSHSSDKFSPYHQIIHVLKLEISKGALFPAFRHRHRAYLSTKPPRILTSPPSTPRSITITHHLTNTTHNHVRRPPHR